MADESNKLQILFVDDEVEFRDNFKYSIELDSVEVITAKSVDTAIEILETQADRIAVIVTDFNMPIKNGVELLQVVIARWPHITRMLCTAYKDLEIAKAAINKGHIHAYFNKPWDVDELNQRILESLGVYEENKLNQKLKLMTESLKHDHSFQEYLLKANYDQLSDFCTGVMGAADFLLMENGNSLSDISNREFLLKLTFVSGRINQIRAANLLDYCRIRNGSFQLHDEKADFNRLTQRILEDFLPFFEVNQKTFGIQYQGLGPDTEITMDQAKIYQILVSILSYCTSIGDNSPTTLTIELKPTSAKKIQELIFKLEYGVPSILNESSLLQNTISSAANPDTSLMDEERFAGAELDLFMAQELAKSMGGSVSFKINSGHKIVFFLRMEIKQ